MTHSKPKRKSEWARRKKKRAKALLTDLQTRQVKGAQQTKSKSDKKEGGEEKRKQKKQQKTCTHAYAHAYAQRNDNCGICCCAFCKLTFWQYRFSAEPSKSNTTSCASCASSSSSSSYFPTPFFSFSFVGNLHPCLTSSVVLNVCACLALSCFCVAAALVEDMCGKFVKLSSNYRE